MKKMSRYEIPWGRGDQLFVIKTGEWKYQKPVFNRATCSLCGNCYIHCPTGCIEDKGKYFSANEDYCKGCGICATICPVNAIRMVREDGR